MLYKATVSACHSMAQELVEVKHTLSVEKQKNEKCAEICQSQKKSVENLKRQVSLKVVSIEKINEAKNSLTAESQEKSRQVAHLTKEIAAKDEAIQCYSEAVIEVRKERKNAKELARYYRKRTENLSTSTTSHDDLEIEKIIALQTNVKECQDLIEAKDDLILHLDKKG